MAVLLKCLQQCLFSLNVVVGQLPNPGEKGTRNRIVTDFTSTLCDARGPPKSRARIPPAPSRTLPPEPTRWRSEGASPPQTKGWPVTPKERPSPKGPPSESFKASPAYLWFQCSCLGLELRGEPPARVSPLVPFQAVTRCGTALQPPDKTKMYLFWKIELSHPLVSFSNISQQNKGCIAKSYKIREEMKICYFHNKVFPLSQSIFEFQNNSYPQMVEFS